MVQKNQNHKKYTNRINKAYTALGITAMLLATTFGFLEHAERESHKFVEAFLPAYSTVMQQVGAADATNDHELRRSSAKEEIHHSSASYGSMRRSPSVSGGV